MGKTKREADAMAGTTAKKKRVKLLRGDLLSSQLKTGD